MAEKLAKAKDQIEQTIHAREKKVSESKATSRGKSIYDTDQMRRRKKSR